MRSSSGPAPGVVPYRLLLLCLLCLPCLPGPSSAMLRPGGLEAPGVFLSQLARSRAREKRPEPAPGEQARISGRLDGGGGGFPMEGDSLEQLEASSDEASRWSRSPRRCVRHQQSCMSSTLPCCDACDTCYCRFFKAFCYCRRVGHVCPLART
ncbi:uncharacterized protein LOC144194387 [Stigmatopora nigra]